MIYYTDSTDSISAELLKGFFVGWAIKPSPDIHLALLSGSSYRILAIDDLTGDVVGFITAITDGLLSAYIPLLEVLPNYQGRGIGQELVRQMIEKLKHLYMIDLVCDPAIQSFYQKFGMKLTSGMSIRNYQYQSVI